MDVLKEVDVLLKDKKGNHILYIESKYIITNESLHRQALAQTILTNKKQTQILSRVALIYQDKDENDILELIDCTDNSVMYNNDINWEAERPSSPSKDAVDRINDRINGKITQYINDEIKEFYELLKKQGDTQIAITENNINVVYNQWKSNVLFKEKIDDEQDLINLFLVDILNGTTYKKEVVEENGLFSGQAAEQDLIREGTKLSRYRLMLIGDVIDGIKYSGETKSDYYTIADKDNYVFFWRKYKRPPEKNEFLKILEHSASLYTEKYRKDTGGEYTPFCFVEKQNEILAQHYNLNDYIVFDPCAGVGNLENQFGKDYKQYCYLSTLEQMDVDICKIKGFENAVKFDYLKDNEQPKWKHGGTLLGIDEICKRENRKLMVVMNPPYQQKTGFKYDLVIEFFIKVMNVKPDVIVYYTKTEFFLRDTVNVFADSGYKIISHIFSNAKDTFRLSEWPISQVIFDRNRGNEISRHLITVDRYDYDEKNNRLNFVKPYTYVNSRPNLVKELENKIKENYAGMVLGQWTNQSYCLVLSNRQDSTRYITSKNIKYALLLKGINFNTHAKYFEKSSQTYKGVYEDISEQLIADAIMFSLFYKGCDFSNCEGNKNYIMPFTAAELGCEKNALNVLYPEKKEIDLFTQTDVETEMPFDFRGFMTQFKFSKEAQDLYKAALQIARFYHSNDEYTNKDWNDSFYDITNAIMGKDTSSFKDYDSENDKRITKVKTTKGTKGFGRNTIKYVVNSENLPIFEHFFDVRDVLARKINDQLVAQGLLLWKRENVY